MLTYPLFDLEHVTMLGLPFLEENHYQRFPKACINEIYHENPALEWLGYHLSGGTIFFETDAKELIFSIQYANEPLMNHMAPSGESGFDIYVEHDGKWIFYDVIRPFPRQRAIEVTIKLPSDNIHKVMMYTPLYARVTAAHVSTDEKNFIRPWNPHYKKKIFFYGTSITQGACASRPGLSYTNQISRMLSCEIMNMGFSGNGLGEPSIAKMTHLCPDLDLVVIDYDANAGAVGKIEETLTLWIETVRKFHHHIPILIISRIPFNREYFSSSDKDMRLKNKKYQHFVSSSMDDVHFIDGESLIFDHETEVTVDGIHLNDHGMTLYASRLAPYIAALLKR